MTAWSLSRRAGALSAFAVLAILAPRPAAAQSLLDAISAGRWAIGTPAGCAVPGRTYWLSRDANTVTWRSGTGSIDVEAVVAEDPSRASTITVRSFRSGGGRPEPTGTTWSYERMDPTLIRVMPRGRSPFFLARCR